MKLHSYATLACQNGSSERHIGVHNSGQDRMTFLVSQGQPGLGRCYLRTSDREDLGRRRTGMIVSGSIWNSPTPTGSYLEQIRKRLVLFKSNRSRRLPYCEVPESFQEFSIAEFTGHNFLILTRKLRH